MLNEKKQGDINSDSIFEDEIIETEKEIQKREKKEKLERLKEMGIKIIKFIGIFTVVALIGYSILSDSTKDNDIQNVPSEAEIKETALKKELSGKYNAVIFDDNEYHFSKDLQENIDKNFLIEGWVHDIYRQDEKYFIRIKGSGYFGIFEINNENLNYIAQNKNDDIISDDFFVIVKIATVSKSLFEMKAERDGEDTYAYNESSDDFLLKGTALDIKKID